jgi:hypothetical protein
MKEYLHKNKYLLFELLQENKLEDSQHAAIGLLNTEKHS